MGCQFIKRVCKALNVNLLVICSAQVFFQRFFASQSLRRHDRFLVAQACIFLACKAEENVKDMNELLAAAHCVRFNDDALRLADDAAALKAMQDSVIRMERIVLQTLSFDIATELPQTHLGRLAKRVCQDTVDTSELLQTAWCIANDSFSTNVCLFYAPSAIAAAAIVLAARFLRERTDDASRFRVSVEQVAKAEKKGQVGEHAMAALKSIIVELAYVYKASAPRATYATNVARCRTLANGPSPPARIDKPNFFTIFTTCPCASAATCARCLVSAAPLRRTETAFSRARLRQTKWRSARNRPRRGRRTPRAGQPRRPFSKLWGPLRARASRFPTFASRAPRRIRLRKFGCVHRPWRRREKQVSRALAFPSRTTATTRWPAALSFSRDALARGFLF